MALTNETLIKDIENKHFDNDTKFNVTFLSFSFGYKNE